MTTDPADTPKVITVAEGVYVWQAVDNMAWVLLGDWAVVIDALEQPGLEEDVFAAIRSTLGGEKPIRCVLNTHVHGDHVALNPAFQRRCGAEVVNARTGRIPPEGRWFEGSARRVQMLHVPGCHTSEDCVIWLPADKVLFVGDIFGWGLINYSATLDDRAAALLIDTHRRLIDFGADVVVPGHGPLCTNAELGRWVEYFQWLCREVPRACAAGKSDAQITRLLAPPEDMKDWWRFIQWKHDDSLRRVLHAVRGGWMGL